MFPVSLLLIVGQSSSAGSMPRPLATRGLDAVYLAGLTAVDWVTLSSTKPLAFVGPAAAVSGFLQVFSKRQDTMCWLLTWLITRSFAEDEDAPNEYEKDDFLVDEVEEEEGGEEEEGDDEENRKERKRRKR